MTYHRPITADGATPAPSLEERAVAAYGLGLPLRSAPPAPPPPPAGTGAGEPAVLRSAPLPAAPTAAPARGAGAIQRVDRVLLEAAGAIVPGGSVTGLAEEMRIIKRQILRAVGEPDAGPQSRRVLVASANPGEGKTFTAINLALSIAAEADHEALLIDADFAKPSIVEALGLTGGPGLMDALADPSMDVARAVIDTDVPGLSVLPAGRATLRDSELLAADRTRAVLAQLEAGHPRRIIIFDSPPVLAASPATVLAGHAATTLMIVRADATTEAALRDAVGLMSAAGDIQLILNGVKFTPGGRRFGTYYGKGAGR